MAVVGSVRDPSIRVLALSLALLLFTPAAAAQDVCPNPPESCTTKVTKLVSGGGHRPGGIEFTFGNVTGVFYVLAENSRATAGGNVSVPAGGSAQVNIDVKAAGNGSVRVRLTVHPEVDGVEWTGTSNATDQTLTVDSNYTTVSFPFRLAADDGAVAIPVYVILEEDSGDPQVGKGVLGVEVRPLPSTRTSSTPPPSTPDDDPDDDIGIPGLALPATALLLVALAALGRKRWT